MGNKFRCRKNCIFPLPGACYDAGNSLSGLRMSWEKGTHLIVDRCLPLPLLVDIMLIAGAHIEVIFFKIKSSFHFRLVAN